MTITAHTRAQVAALLGREPRGLEAIALAAANGQPIVIRVASLVDEKPFPTLFWLVDPDICYRIDQAEAQGLIKQLQHTIDAEPQLQAKMLEDHRDHIALRARYISSTSLQRLDDLGYGAVLQSKGIGGIADFARIRCLHTWYAAHLIVPNTIGRLLDDWWRDQPSAGRT